MKILILPLILVLCIGTSTAQEKAQDKAQDVPAPKQRYGQGLGRLLTTEAERSKLDDVRFNIQAPKPITVEGPPQWLISGITQRPDRPQGQRVTVWIDGRAHLENALPYGITLVRDKNGEVTGVTSNIGKGKVETAKIGDMVTRPQTMEEAKLEKEGKAAP